nr:hypothetical protein [Tanacetum cinerariifolium]
ERKDDQIEELNLTNGADTEVIVEDKGSGEKTLIKIRSEKPKEKGVAFRDVEEPPRLTRSTTTLKPLPTIDPKDKEKKSVEPESKDKKGKRIKRVTDSAPKHKSSKKQKMMQEQESAKSNEEESANYEQENKELRMWLTVVSDEEETMDLEILSTKYPIVDWESRIFGNVDMKDKHVYKIIRANGNTSYHKSLSSMLRKFDRQDMVDLHRLMMKGFKDNTPEVEKRYPLIREMLEKMLNWKLEAEAESTMAFDLLKFIKS